MIRASKGLLEPKKAARIVQDGIAKRKKSGERFKIIGVIAVGVTLAFLIALFSSILAKGIPGFFQYYITLEVKVDRKKLDPDNNLSIQSLYNGDARGVIRKAVYDAVGATNRSKKRIAGKIVSNGAEDRLRKAIIDNPNILNTTQSMTFAVDDDVDSFLRGFISRDTPESERRINNQMIAYIEDLKIQGRISYRLSDYLIFGSASRNAEMAGIKGAFIGSLFTLSICFMIAFPLGISTAIYLEEIAPKNRITELIEININNLAAVPSVVFGILGLAVFISIFGMPRSIPLIGESYLHL